MYEGRGIFGKDLNVRTVIGKIAHTCRECNWGRRTPGNVIKTRKKGDGNAI